MHLDDGLDDKITRHLGISWVGLLTHFSLILNSLAVSRFRLCVLGSMQFEVVDVIALCKVPPNEEHSKCDVKF